MGQKGILSFTHPGSADGDLSFHHLCRYLRQPTNEYCTRTHMDLVVGAVDFSRPGIRDHVLRDLPVGRHRDLGFFTFIFFAREEVRVRVQMAEICPKHLSGSDPIRCLNLVRTRLRRYPFTIENSDHGHRFRLYGDRLRANFREASVLPVRMPCWPNPRAVRLVQPP